MKNSVKITQGTDEIKLALTSRLKQCKVGKYTWKNGCFWTLETCDNSLKLRSTSPLPNHTSKQITFGHKLLSWKLVVCIQIYRS